MHYNILCSTFYVLYSRSYILLRNTYLIETYAECGFIYNSWLYISRDMTLCTPDYLPCLHY